MKRPTRSTKPCISLFPPGILHPAFLQLLTDFHDPPRPESRQRVSSRLAGYKVRAVHRQLRLWTQSGEPILPEFRKLIENNYEGGLYPVDFRHAAAAARQHINQWVEEQTRGKIKDLLKPQNVDSRTELILTNAIYFKALWADPFSPQFTKPDDFHASASEKVRVDMMHLSGRFRYAEDGAAQALELPYQGGDLAMVIVLPRDKDGLSQLEASLSLARLDGVLKSLASRRVEISLPRFKLAAECELTAYAAQLHSACPRHSTRRSGRLFSGITGNARAGDLGRGAQGVRRSR